jgi:hypothetical protein
MSDAPDYLRMSPEELSRLPGPAPAVITPPPAAAAPAATPDYLRMSPEELGKFQDPQQRTWSQNFKAALPGTVSTLVRGTGGLIDAAWDPYGTVMSVPRMIWDPKEEARYQSGEQPGPGRKLGDAFFRWTGMPEYIPQTPRERTVMAAGQSAIAGAPFGPVGAALAAAGGGANQAVVEATKTEENPEGNQRRATVAGLVPSILAQGGAGATAAARARAQARITPELYEAGVRPTIGQALGGAFNATEEKISSIPGFGDFMAGGRRGAVEQFNRGAIDRRLETIGERLDPHTPLGRPAIAEAQDALGRAYDRLEPRLNTQVDAPFLAGDMPRINASAARLRPGERTTFDDIYQNDFLRHTGPGGTLDGPAFRRVESEVGRRANNYRGSPDPNHRELGDVLSDLQNSLRDLQVRSNPQHAEALQRLHNAYADFQRVQGAAAAIGTDSGTFTPNQLLRSVLKQDPSLNHRLYASGRARMQDYAEQGTTLLGNRVPDSGTATRGMTAYGLGSLASWFADPAAAAGLLGGAGALGLAYSPLGRRLTTDFLLREPGVPPIVPGLLAQDYEQRR